LRSPISGLRDHRHELHPAGDADIDPRAFEKTELAKLGMPLSIAHVHRHASVPAHLLGGRLFRRVLQLSLVSKCWITMLLAFTEAGGPDDKAVAKRLRHDHEQGNTATLPISTAPSEVAILM